MTRVIEFDRIYRRIEASDRGNDALTTVLPTIEIRGSTTVSVFGSNQCSSLEIITGNTQDKYTPPFSDIDTEMTLTDTGLLPGLHEACICTTWSAFRADDPLNPPIVYDCGIIDWEFDTRRKQQEEIC